MLIPALSQGNASEHDASLLAHYWAQLALCKGNASEYDASLLAHYRAQLALCKGITKMQDSQTAGSYFDFGALWRVAPLAGCPRLWHKGMGCRSPVLVMIFRNGARLPYSTDPQNIAIEAV